MVLILSWCAGVTTDMLHKRCKWVLGIDTATDPLDRCGPQSQRLTSLATSCSVRSTLHSNLCACLCFWLQGGQTLLAGHTQQSSEPDCRMPVLTDNAVAVSRLATLPSATAWCWLHMLARWRAAGHIVNVYMPVLCCAVAPCRAKARYPHVRFEHMNGFDIDALTALSPTGTYGEQ
jgi:hypothetical protein